MPREGIFGVVIKGGTINVDDEVEVLEKYSTSVAFICSADDEKTHGEQLESLAAEKWQPGVIRFDQIKKENNLQAILDDLLNTQKVNRIVLFDPSGQHALAFAGRQADESIDFIYCKSISELETL